MELIDTEESKSLASKYRIKKVLGGGGNSSTFIAEVIADPGKEYVLKMINLDDVENSELLKDEVKLHQQLSEHESIIAIIDHFIEKNILYILTEYAAKGDLKIELSKRKIKIEDKKRGTTQEGSKQLFSSEEILELMINISKGVVFIHSQSIVHKDLKPANIFLTIDETPQIGDFGISRVLKDQQYIFSVNCTIDYAPPELLSFGRFDFKGDVWSLGVILYELCTGSKPFGFLSGQAKIDFIIAHQPDFTKLNDRLPTLRLLIKSMLKKNPEWRPNMKSVLKSLLIIQNKEEEIVDPKNMPLRTAITIPAHPNQRFYEEMKMPLVDTLEASSSINLIDELNKEKHIENIKMSIYRSSNIIKWICALLLITSLSQILSWIDNGYLSYKSPRGQQWKRIWPNFQTLFILNSFLGYTEHYKLIWLDLVNYLFDAIIAIYGITLSSKLTKFRSKWTLFIYLILLIFYIIKIICICSILGSMKGALLNIQANIYVFEISIPMIFYIIIILMLCHLQLYNYYKINRLDTGSELEISHQFTKDPLYQYCNLVYGGSIGVVLLGAKYFFFSICQSINWEKLDEDNPQALVYAFVRSILYIGGGTFCLLKIKLQDRMKASRMCYYIMLFTQTLYMIFSALIKFDSIEVDHSEYWMIPQDFFIAIVTTGILWTVVYSISSFN